MDIPFHSEQVNLLFDVAAWRNTGLDVVFRFLNLFDTEYFIMLLIPFVWVGLSYRWGLRVAFLLVFSTLLNFHLKHFFDMARPILDYPDLAMFPFKSPGMPSGAAQTAALLATLLIYTWKSPWSWVVGIGSALTLGLSRIYLAVHYPLDVVVGFGIGLTIGLVFIFSYKRLERFLLRQGAGFCMLMILVVSFCYIFLTPVPFIYRIIGAFAGFGAGACLCSYNRLFIPPARNRSYRILSGVAAVATVFMIYFMLPAGTPILAQSLIMSLWISLGAPRFCRFIISA